MPEIKVAFTISPQVLADLQNLPRQMENLMKNARQALDQPLGPLLGDLSNLARDSGSLPAIDHLLPPLQDLLEKLPSASLMDLSTVQSAVEEVLDLLGPLKEVLLSGNLEKPFADALKKAIDSMDRMFQETPEVQGVFGELEEFFRLFRVLLGWEHQPPRPEEVADFLSRTLLGLSTDILQAPAAALEAALAPLTDLLPSGPELNRWREAPGVRLAFWQDITARFTGGGPLDWPRLEADLHGEAGVLLEIGGLRDRLLSLALAKVNRLDFGPLDQVAASLHELPAVPRARLSEIFDGLRLQLQGVIQELDAWKVPEAEVRAMVRTFMREAMDLVGETPLGYLRHLLLDFFERLRRAIESLPFLELARKIEAALREVAASLEILDPDFLRQPVHEFFQKISDRLGQVSTIGIQQAAQQLWQAVDQAFSQVNSLMDTLRTTLQDAVAQIQQFLQQAQPAMTDLSQQVAAISAKLEAFDLNPPAQAVIDELHKLRDTVQGIDVSNLPAPAVSTLKVGAEGLRQLDLAGTINPPLNDELAKLDPSPLIQEARAGLEGVSAQLKLLDPVDIANRLDVPVNELVQALGQVGPDALQQLILQALKPIENAIRSLDFTKFFAPLTRLFADLLARVEIFLNPNPIFSPLESAFQPVVTVVEALNPARFIALVEPHAGPLAEKVGTAAGPPSTVAKAGTLLKDAIAPSPEAPDPLFGLRPGDMLIPLVDLHQKLMQIFNGLDNAVLEPAARLFQQSVAGRLQDLNPAQISLQVEASLAQVHLEFDTAASSTRLQDAALAYHEAVQHLVAGVGQLPPEVAPVAARVLTLLPQLDPLTLVPVPDQGEAVFSASLEAEDRLDLGGLQSSFAVLANLENLLPPFLASGDLGAASLRQALKDLDPAPIRAEINALFDQVGQRIVGLEAPLIGALEEFWLAVEEFYLPLTPAGLLQLAHRLYADLKDQLLAFHPSRFKDEVQLIFTAVQDQLKVFNPASLVEEFNGLRDQLLQTLEDLAGKLVLDPKPFQDLESKLAGMKPSLLLAPVTDSLKPVSELVAKLDVKVLFDPLLAAMDKVRSQIPQIIADVEAALDQVLAAFPEGGITGVSVEVSAQVSVG